MARAGNDHSSRLKSAQKLQVNSSGGVCKAGFDTETSTFAPPDDTTEDNPAAGTVVMTKGCAGAAAVTFSGESNTDGTGQFIDLDFYATCTGTGGFTSHHCTVGSTRFGSPGTSLFQDFSAGVSAHSVTEVFTGLNRGKWRFEVVPGGDGAGSLIFRTTMVQAYNGG